MTVPPTGGGSNESSSSSPSTVVMTTNMAMVAAVTADADADADADKEKSGTIKCSGIMVPNSNSSSSSSLSPTTTTTTMSAIDTITMDVSSSDAEMVGVATTVPLGGGRGLEDDSSAVVMALESDGSGSDGTTSQVVVGTGVNVNAKASVMDGVAVSTSIPVPVSSSVSVSGPSATVSKTTTPTTTTTTTTAADNNSLTKNTGSKDDPITVSDNTRAGRTRNNSKKRKNDALLAALESEDEDGSCDEILSSPANTPTKKRRPSPTTITVAGITSTPPRTTTTSTSTSICELDVHIPVPHNVIMSCDGDDNDNIQLPDGWTFVIRLDNTKKRYKHYYSPKLQLRLRSRPEIKRFIHALNTQEANGDEDKAYTIAGLRGGGYVKKNNKKNNNKNIDNDNHDDYDNKNDPKPKRPPSPYVAYINYHREQVKKDHSNDSKVNGGSSIVSKILTKMWNELSDKKRNEFKQKDQHLWDAFNIKMNDWKARNPHRNKNKNNKKIKRGPAQLPPASLLALSNVSGLAIHDEVFSCIGCGKRFKSKAGLSSHKRFCDHYKNAAGIAGGIAGGIAAGAGSSSSLSAAAVIKEPQRKKPKTNNDDNDWYVVEGLRGRRINSSNGAEEYLIKWKDFPDSDNTWECYETLDPVIQEVAKEWYTESKNYKARQRKQLEDMKRLGLIVDGDDGDDGSNNVISLEEEDNTFTLQRSSAVPPLGGSRGSEKGVNTHIDESVIEDTNWKWDESSQINFRDVQRIDVNSENVRQLVTDARINGTPVVLTGHIGWANFAKRWLRKRSCSDIETNNTGNSTVTGITNATATAIATNESAEAVVKSVIDSMMTRLEQQTTTTPGDATNSTGVTSTDVPSKDAKDGARVDSIVDNIDSDDDLLDLSDPCWYLDVQAMSDDIGSEEVPVVKRNYNESKPISGNILASKFIEAGWPDAITMTKIENQRLMSSSSSAISSLLLSPSSKKKKKSALYLHQWQFPLSEMACEKLCHKSVPLPNHILGEDLLKYWLDRVKLDSPLQYLFMGREDTMSKIHRDPGGLAISIAPITGEKECVLVHRDDGHACLYHTRASLDPDRIDLDAYPLLPYARIWKTSIFPGEILLMPHGTYHQCQNITPCLSYSRFHLDVINLRAFLQSLFDGDASELQQDEVLWNAAQEIIRIIEKATDEKRQVDTELVDTVGALRALRNITREITRKLHVRQTVKGITSAESSSLLSAVKIDGDMEIWQKLVDDIDITLHEFRYRFNIKLPAFRKKRLVGKKILALPAMAFRGKAKPAKLSEITGRNNEPVVAFECPTDRGFLSLSKAPAITATAEERKIVTDDIDLVAVGDKIMVRIEGRQCSGKLIEVASDMHVACMSFEDLPSLYNDYIPCDLIRIPSVGGSCLVEPPLEEIKPGKLMIGLIGKDEYRGIVQHVKRGKMFKVELDFGNEYTVERLIDSDSILSVTSLKCRDDDQKNKQLQQQQYNFDGGSPATDPVAATAKVKATTIEMNEEGDKSEETITGTNSMAIE